MNIPSYPFHFLSLKLPNKIINFSFSSLKLSNKGREKYSKIIIFILFHFISFPSPKRGLNEKQVKNRIEKFYRRDNQGSSRTKLGIYFKQMPFSKVSYF